MIIHNPLPLLITFCSLLLFSCSNYKTSYNTIDYTETELSMAYPIIINDFSSIFEHSVYSGFTSDDGTLLDTFIIKKSGMHQLSNMLLSLDVYLEKGDVTEVKAGLNDANPEVKFSGDHAEMNNALFENKNLFVSTFSKVNRNNLSEDQLLQAIKEFKNKKEKLTQNKILSSRKVVSEYVKTWNESSIISTILLVKYKLNKFSRKKIETPKLDPYLKEFNPTDSNCFKSCEIYKMASYEYHKWLYNEKYDGDTDLERFQTLLSGIEMNQDIRDYLLSIYATNYYITEYYSDQKVKKSYDYLLTVVMNLECRDYLYKKYLLALKSK